MQRLLPPLHALRAFEAAARHSSFSRAAAELCVSTAAISRQIRSLETFLGRSLFERLTRRVQLTEFGVFFFGQVSTALALVEDATRAAVADADTKLVIDTMPTTANLCLLPWLSHFTDETHIDAEVVSSMAPVDFVASRADVSIRVGAHPGRQAPRGAIGRIPHQLVTDWTGVTAERLWEEVFVPVCSARYLRDHPELGTPADEGGRHLIHVVSRPNAWGDWLASQGRDRRLRDRGLEVGHSLVALQTARRHRGIALAATVHLNALEWRNEMICPWQGALRSEGAFYLLYRTADAKKDKVAAFLRWIRRQGDDGLPAAAAAAPVPAEAPKRRARVSRA